MSSILGELKANLWDHIGILVPPKRLKVTYSTTKGKYGRDAGEFGLTASRVWGLVLVLGTGALNPAIAPQPLS